MSRGNVPNMHIPTGGITIPPRLIGQDGPSLIDKSPPNAHYPSASHVPMANYMAGGIPEPSLT